MVTGKTRYRSGFMKTLVLQVEESFCSADDCYGSSFSNGTRWRDARIEDLAELERISNEREKA